MNGGILRDKRFLLAATLLVGIVVLFWAGSRYPQLSEKAAMGGDLGLDDPLAFDALLPVEGDDPFVQRVVSSTVNWGYTNYKGMTFGLLLGAALMTLLPLLRAVAFQGVFPNTLLGVVLGAPLGVCVNCAAPIARGLHASGARIETSLAAMISSPTLNLVVITMLFSLFPFYIAALKLGLTLLFLLAVIPVLTQTAFQRESLAVEAAQRLGETPGRAPHPTTAEAIGPAQGWASALGWVARTYGENLWFIVRYSVPLMMVAGLLGALLIHAFPLEDVVGLFPAGGAVPMGGALLLVGLMGLLLPVPIAFDVVLVAALFAGGLPAPYAMALLFTLGVFSVYSFSIVWEAISLRVAAIVSAALLVFGLLAAGGVHLYDLWDEPRQSRILFAGLAALAGAPAASGAAPPPVDAPPAAEDTAALLEALHRDALAWSPVAAPAARDIEIERVALRARGAPADVAAAPPRGGNGGRSPHFRRHYGETLGLSPGDRGPLLYRFGPPGYRNWPVAAGDVHGDGWTDVLLGSSQGPLLFVNRRGERFVPQRIDVPALAGSYASNVALVDLDGDGRLDIFVSAYRGGNHVVYNDHGRFHTGGHRPLPETRANLANAAAFADLDRDGDLDVVLGNWSTGPWTDVPPPNSRNVVLWNRGKDWLSEPLPGVPGETLSVLVSDVNHDGRPDVLVGNDFTPPDAIYLQGEDGLGTPLERSNGIIPRGTWSTMSIDSGDVNNDLALDLYFGQITGRRSGQEGRLRRLDADEVCDREHADHAGWRSLCRTQMQRLAEIRRGRARQDARACRSIADVEGRGGCLAWLLLNRAVRREQDPALCDLFPPHWERFSYICHYAFRKFEGPYPTREQRLKQDKKSNVLLVATENGRFDLRSGPMGVDVAGWTWNAKFADFDNDEWQDLYAVNGTVAPSWRESNFYFANVEGRTFVDRTEEMGLDGFLVSPAYAAVDLDHDGDLDLVSQTTNGPVWVHRNEGRNGEAILFEFRDERGNPFAVGSKIVIRYGPGGSRHQIREIKASGGFLSFEPPRAHFGLGDHTRVTRVEIEWSTGERDVLDGEFEAGYRYRITRRSGRG
jgi:uncharacterized membrane protein YraQ (UPF0718 family)